MECQIVTGSEATEIRIADRLTYDDHPRFLDLKARALAAASRRVVVDVSGLDFIDSAGLGMLVILDEAARAAGVNVTLRGARGIVRKLMDLVNFNEIIKIED